MSQRPNRWSDLGVRVASAVVLIAIAATALMMGGPVWMALVFVITIAMLWELGPLAEPGLTGKRRSMLALSPVLGLGAMALAATLITANAPIDPQFGTPAYWGYAVYLVALGWLVTLIAGAVVLRRGRLIWMGYATLILAASAFFIAGSDQFGMAAIGVLITIVVLSDTAGYFAGRFLGGPKFWPRVSPKKTWSGTVAGWIVCGLFTGYVAFRIGMPIGLGLVAGVALSFAGQMGDIVESALKRRAGVKDSSNLIPGHGGVLDRFDALIAAAALALTLAIAWG